MEEHRGRNRVELFLENRKTVEAWITKNPKKNMRECSNELGLSYTTTRQHIKAILEG